MSGFSDRPSPVECGMCRKRLTNLEQVQVDLSARLAGQAEEMRLVRESVAELHDEMKTALADMRRDFRMAQDVLQGKIESVHREVTNLGDSNVRIEKLLERVLQAVGARQVAVAVQE